MWRDGAWQAATAFWRGAAAFGEGFSAVGSRGPLRASTKLWRPVVKNETINGWAAAERPGRAYGVA